jgi:RNA methyltransferase, TrmH family
MTDIISSLQNPRVKLATLLQTNARARRNERKIVLEGTRLIRDALERGKIPDFVLYELRGADFELVAKLQEAKVTVLPVAPEIIKHISDTQQPQGMIGVFHMPKPHLPSKPQRVLILDALREPGNMGTILRTAGAAGVQVILLGTDCVDPYNPKVLRAGMGAHFRLPIIEASWQEIASYCEELTIYLAAADGTASYTAVDWRAGWALVIGNEAHGVQRSAQLAAQRIAIPMAANTESLNAAMATAVILFEAQRPRGS